MEVSRFSEVVVSIESAAALGTVGLAREATHVDPVAGELSCLVTGSLTAAYMGKERASCLTHFCKLPIALFCLGSSCEA